MASAARRCKRMAAVRCKPEAYRNMEKWINTDYSGPPSPSRHKHLPCKPLWHWLAGEATAQYQSGLQPSHIKKFGLKSDLQKSSPAISKDCLRRHGRAPVRSAEHRRKLRGSRRGLFERLQAASSAAAADFEKRREPAGRVSRVAFSLDTFFWRSKRKYLGRGTNSRPKSIARQRTTNQWESLCLAGFSQSSKFANARIGPGISGE